MDKQTLLPLITTSEKIHDHDSGIVAETDERGFNKTDHIQDNDTCTSDKISRLSGQEEDLENIQKAQRQKRKIKIAKLKERIKKKKHKTKSHKHEITKITDAKELGCSSNTIDVNISTDEEPSTSPVKANDLPNVYQVEKHTDDEIIWAKGNHSYTDSDVEKTNNMRQGSGVHIGLEKSNRIKQEPETELNVRKSENYDATQDHEPFINKTSSENKAAKILSLCRRGDWTVLEQILRNTRKDSHFVHVQDQVSHLHP